MHSYAIDWENAVKDIALKWLDSVSGQEYLGRYLEDNTPDDRYEEGYEAGHDEGQECGYETGYSDGYEQGLDDQREADLDES